MYCATFYELRTLEEEMDMKARLWIPPGTYPVPSQAGTFDFILPLCLQMRQPGSQPELSGLGSIEADSSSLGENIIASMSMGQPLRDASNKEYWFFADISDQLAAGDTMLDVFDGEHPEVGSGYFGVGLCAGSAQCYDGYRFDSCTFDGYPDNRHRVVFDGGWVELHLVLGESMDSTEPGIFLWAEGELDGTSFEQRDYFQLIYRPEHHHFGRHFAVLFDDSISGACGLRIEDVIPWSEAALPTVSLCDCDLAVLGGRQVDEHSLEIQ